MDAEGRVRSGSDYGYVKEGCGCELDQALGETVGILRQTVGVVRQAGMGLGYKL